MRLKKQIIQSIIFLFIFTGFQILAEDQGFDQVQIQSTKISEHVYMLTGQGGNIGAFMAKDSILLVDDQFAPLTEKIKVALGQISNKTVRFVINTHWHQDHVGGNEKLGKFGAVIVAHENVRKRMSTGQFMKFFKRQVPSFPDDALPVITFTRDIAFHLDDEIIQVFHLHHAHTDGDSVVYFQKANVIHTGDIFFSGIYPFIDTGSSGSIDGIIDAAKHILAMINQDTVIIPGHGPISDKTQLSAYINMLSDIRNTIAHAISEGKTLEEVQTEKPTQPYDKEWADGFISPDQFVAILFEDLSRQ